MLSGEATPRVSRRLAAILVIGYRRLFPGHERERVLDLRAVFAEVLEPLIREHGGSIFKEAGDLALSDFADVVAATRSAAAIRSTVLQRNQTLAPERRIAIRIGINLGTIIAEGGDVFGDAVNVAARLEALADPGSIYVSEVVYDKVADSLDFEFEDLGLKKLKNIQQPVRIRRTAGGTGDWPENVNPWPTTSLGELDNRRAIAVLPFMNFSGDPDQEFFADGITEDIISRLAGWRAFPVIARNSTFNYKGQKKVDVKEIAKELGAFYVVEGSVRKSGHRVRVTAQLIRADTNQHILAERYDRDLTDLFALQEEIVAAIAGNIEPELLKFERERVAERPQQSEDAYELYQHGMWHHYRHTREDNVEAQSYFRRALAIDAEYPQAAAALTIAVLNAGFLGWTEHAEANFAEAYELGQSAIHLDPHYPNAHYALGLVCMWTQRIERGIAALEEAISLNPSFAAAHVMLGQMYVYVGRREEAIELAETGIRLSPADPRLDRWLPALAGAHYQLRHYAEAVEAGRRSWTLNRNWPHGLRYVVAGLAQLGRIEDAQVALTALKQMDANLEYSASVFRRNWPDPADVDHLLDGLRKAGFE
jgi:adenylate cyclase